MISTAVVVPQPIKSNLFEQSVGAVAQIAAKPTNRSLRLKVGRQFFEHDTRKNTSFASPLHGRNPRTRCRETYAGAQYAQMSPLAFSPENLPAPSFACVETSNQKLRRKLLRVQRQLRLQTEAIRMHQQYQQHCQQYPQNQQQMQQPQLPVAAIKGGGGGGCCCSCVNVSPPMMMHPNDARALAGGIGGDDLMQHGCLASEHGSKNAVGFQPYRVHGMRSVVRYHIRLHLNSYQSRIRST